MRSIKKNNSATKAAKLSFNSLRDGKSWRGVQESRGGLRQTALRRILQSMRARASFLPRFTKLLLTSDWLCGFVRHLEQDLLPPDMHMQSRRMIVDSLCLEVQAWRPPRAGGTKEALAKATSIARG
jgi:hypothetical protein